MLEARRQAVNRQRAARCESGTARTRYFPVAGQFQMTRPTRNYAFAPGRVLISACSLSCVVEAFCTDIPRCSGEAVSAMTGADVNHDKRATGNWRSRCLSRPPVGQSPARQTVRIGYRTHPVLSAAAQFSIRPALSLRRRNSGTACPFFLCMLPIIQFDDFF
jgi:hypothetical protein